MVDICDGCWCDIPDSDPGFGLRGSPTFCPTCAAHEPEEEASSATRQTTWAPIETHPKDRYILLCDKNSPAWDGNKEVGIWLESEDGCGEFWSCGGANGGLELNTDSSPGHYDRFTHWVDLPDDPE